MYFNIFESVAYSESERVTPYRYVTKMIGHEQYHVDSRSFTYASTFMCCENRMYPSVISFIVCLNIIVRKMFLNLNSTDDM
jgi:hypothetical protein